MSSMLRTLAVLAAGTALSAPLAAQSVDLTPRSWPAGELERYASLTRLRGERIPLAVGKTGMIASTTQPRAARAGLEALKRGGSAVDAALTHAMADIVLYASCCVSHAGFMTMVYFDAASGKTHSMNAAWNTVLEEKDPLSIPRAPTPSGRTALVPGFMAGAKAAHDRFGKLPWATLFGPAIYFAEEGFVADSGIIRMIESKKIVLSRLPATKSVFTRPDGQWHQPGDLFKQPLLAQTLRKVASEGADYMYRGEWARKLVAAVQADGGKMTMKDLESYRVIWGEPVRTRFREYELAAIGRPNTGGVNMAEALNLVELADLRSYGHYSTSPEAFFRFVRIARMADLMGTSLTARGVAPIVRMRHLVPNVDPSLDARPTKDAARKLWASMQSKDWDQLNLAIGAPPKDGPDGHSDAVVAVDAQGNAVALLHTINTGVWGSTGIFVDGVAIADPGSYYQGRMVLIEPGERQPEETNPLIVLKDGQPVLVSSSIGMGVHEQTLQSIVNVLEYGMNPNDAVDTAQFLRPVIGGSATRSAGNDASERASQVVGERDFSESLLQAVRAKGQPIQVVPPGQANGWRGGWVGIVIDPETKQLRGGAARYFRGWAEGWTMAAGH